VPRSVRVKRVRQARLRWSVLGLDARVDGFESGYVLACEQRKRPVLYYNGCLERGEEHGRNRRGFHEQIGSRPP